MSNADDTEEYPEHKKLESVQAKSQEIGAFLEWLQHERGFVIATWLDEELAPSHESIEKLLAAYFDVDLNRIEREKRRMLDSLRARSQRATR